jgi:hypothetical protein
VLHVSNSYLGKSLKIKIKEREEIKSWSAKLDTSQALVAPACNTSYLRGCDQEDQSLRTAWANSFTRPHHQINQRKMDWRHGS